MILKHRFNSFRDPWMGPKFFLQLSMRAAHARLSNGCAGIRVCCAPIRADYVVVSPHKYRRMRRLCLPASAGILIGPLGPLARWVRIPCPQAGREASPPAGLACFLMAFPSFSQVAPHSGPLASCGTGALEGPLCHKCHLLCSFGGSRSLRLLPPKPPILHPGYSLGLVGGGAQRPGVARRARGVAPSRLLPSKKTSSPRS